ncbi:MAG TPA: alcohol dehydrogenase [Lachnospiraceae bacterium]|uniref:iron-containing alcohol dehydrogenase n=1 Tax=Anaerosporobacter sp. TaxID=1872529 RepID=UPI000EEE12F2|nr:iron-containing alcohol dehydrogenase [Anaerosporobacter sp.]HAB60561.1 alcohol dehydrogenase [Lachnospiraceae bacterium]
MAQFTVPTHIITGKGALDEAKGYIKSYGKKALIVTGKHVVKSTMMQALIEKLDDLEVEYNIFDGITGEPTDCMIEEGIKVYQDNNCEFLIGIGGGSPLDAAKAIGAMITNPGAIADYNGKEIPNRIPPVVAIPTTAGTGSEATKFTIITDSKKDIKMLLKGDYLIPELAIVDYEFGMTAPRSVTAATGLDALTHAVEAYTSKKATVMTDTLAVSAIKRIVKYLPIVYQDGSNLEAREEMAIAALEAGICINNSSVTLVHGMSRPIGALFHVPHGMSNAMLLTRCMAFAATEVTDRLAILARETKVATLEESDTIAADKFIVKLEEICKICEIPTLSEYGINQDTFDSAIEKMATDAVASGSPSNTRRVVTKEDCMKLYKEVY